MLGGIGAEWQDLERSKERIDACTRVLGPAALGCAEPQFSEGDGTEAEIVGGVLLETTEDSRLTLEGVDARVRVKKIDHTFSRSSGRRLVLKGDGTSKSFGTSPQLCQ